MTIISSLLRSAVSQWRGRGRTRFVKFVDPWLRRGEETVAPIGSVRFPFLREHTPFFYGFYEPANVALVREWLRPGDGFLDVGAHEGYFSALAADCVGPHGQVDAFEPEPGHCGRLRRLAELNPHLRIAVHNAAVTEHDGPIRLHLSENAGWHTTVPAFLAGESRSGIEVRGVSLDRWAADEPEAALGRRIRLAKIDVEGAEGAVLRGAAELLRQRRIEAFLIEVTPPDARRDLEDPRWIFALLEGHGYHALWNPSGEIGRWESARATDIRRQEMVFWRLA